jgi:hypothetical protein
MKAGDRCMTPHGEGTIVHFQIYPPLKLTQEPQYWDECEQDVPEGWFARAGVEGCHPTLDVAYYPLDQIKPIPKRDPQ